jgi:hypothetical protein
VTAFAERRERTAFLTALMRARLSQSEACKPVNRRIISCYTSPTQSGAGLARMPHVATSLFPAHCPPSEFWRVQKEIGGPPGPSRDQRVVFARSFSTVLRGHVGTRSSPGEPFSSAFIILQPAVLRSAMSNRHYSGYSELGLRPGQLFNGTHGILN